jgi:hypothetical protein
VLSANPPANGTQGLVPEEMSQTLLTNKKQGKYYQVHAAMPVTLLRKIGGALNI